MSKNTILFKLNIFIMIFLFFSLPFSLNAKNIIESIIEETLYLKNNRSDLFEECRGVLVLENTENIKLGDIILFFNDICISDSEILSNLLEETDESENIILKIIREGQIEYIDIPGDLFLSEMVIIKEKMLELYLMSHLLEQGRRIEKDIPKAIEILERGLEIALKYDKVRIQGSFYFAIGTLYYNINEYEKSLEFHYKGLNVRRKSGEDVYAGRTLYSLSLAYRRLADNNNALKYYRKAYSEAQEFGDKRTEANALRGMGIIYNTGGDYEKAIKSYQEALDIYIELNEIDNIAGQYGNLGIIYRRIGQFDNALEYLQNALDLSRKTNNSRFIILTANSIGLTYQSLGQYEKAIESYGESLETAKKSGLLSMQSLALNNLGNIFSSLGKHEEAKSHYSQALVISRETNNIISEANALSNIGRSYSNMRDYDKAIEYVNKGYKIFAEAGDRRQELQYYFTIGALYIAAENFQKADESLNKGLELAEKLKNPFYSLSLYQTKGILSYTLGRKIDASYYYERAIEIIETSRQNISDADFRISFMEDKFQIYDEYINILYDLHSRYPDEYYDAKAIEIFERKQARELLELMGRSGTRSFAGVPEEVLEKETALSNKLDNLNIKWANENNPDKKLKIKAEMDNIKTEQREYEKHIKDLYPDYYALKYPSPVDLHQIQKNILKPDEMMLIYSIGEENSHIFLIGRKRFSFYRIEADKDEIKENVQNFLYFNTSSIPVQIRGRIIFSGVERLYGSINLYNILFPKALQEDIKDTQTLYIIPSGPLYALPFEALRDNNDRYLVEDYAIAYLSSASLLGLLRNVRSSREAARQYPLLAFANPNYSEKLEAEYNSGVYRNYIQNRFASLPETEIEVRTIKKILNAPGKSNPLQLKENASVSNLFRMNYHKLLKNYRYIIFACHGILPGEIDDINQPALILSDPDPETGENGFLTMSDIFELEFNAEIISLSACNTGLGTEQRGEGIIGMSRAFMYAGTDALKVSLWPVETMSAKEINISFYRYLNEGRSKAEALRSVKISMIRGKYGSKWTKPFYWAPLILIGNN